MLGLLGHLIDSGVRIAELIELRVDGNWTSQPLRGTPWRWWFGKDDV